MKSIRFLVILLLLSAVILALASCDMVNKVFPDGLPFLPKDTTAGTVTEAPVTTTAPAATTTAEPEVTTTASPIPQKTPADIPIASFDGNLTGYTVTCDSGAETVAAALAGALGLTVGTDPTAKAIVLSIEAEGTIALSAGDYHIFVTGDVVHIRAGSADALSAAAGAFLATVKNGVSSQSPHLHTVYLAAPPVDVSAIASNYADMTELCGTTVGDPLSYHAGDDIIFILTLTTNGTRTGCKTFTYTLEAEDCDIVVEGTADGKNGIFAITVPQGMTLIPGSIRLSVDAFDANGALLPSIYSGTAAQPNITSEITRPSYTYIGGAIVDADRITSDVSRTDEEFLEYWTERLREIEAITPTDTVGYNAKYHNGLGIYQLDADMLTALGCKDYIKYLDRYDMYEVYLRADTDKTNGRPAVGYLTVPKDAAPGSLPINLRLNAYGTRDGYLAVSSTAIMLSMHPCGLPKGSFDENGKYTATDFSIVKSYGKIVADYENPATDCEYTKMFMRNIQMLRFLTDENYRKDSVFKRAKTNMESFDSFKALLAAYNGEIAFWYGGSNGGFQNIATAALMLMEVDGKRLVNGTLTEIIVGCPSMCDSVAYAGRTGRFESVQVGDIWSANGEKLNILNYALYDTVHFASFITEGSLEIIAGFGDVTSPSTGIVALYNATKIEKSLTFTQNKDHSGKDPNTMVSTSVSAQAEQ